MNHIKAGDRVILVAYTATFLHGVAPYSRGTVEAVSVGRFENMIRVAVDDGPEIGWISETGVEVIAEVGE